MRQIGTVGCCVQLSFGSRAKCLDSREATALSYCHMFLFSQGTSLVGKTITLGNHWEFGYVPRDPIGNCRRNRRLLLFVRLRTTWLDRNLPKKQTTVAVCSATYHVTRSKLAEETDDCCCLFGSVTRDSIETCRRNRRLLLFVRLRTTWLDRNLPKKKMIFERKIYWT
jgi:uncharacterized protein YcaQ